MKKSMKKSQTPNTITEIVDFIKKHALVISFALFACLAGYILILTNQLTHMQPDRTSVDAEISSVARPKIQKTVVDTILGLEDRNVDVKAIFEDARENPFSE